MTELMTELINFKGVYKTVLARDGKTYQHANNVGVKKSYLE